MRLYVNLLLPVLLLLSACLHSQNESGAISLPGDRFFDNGLSLRGNDSADPFTGKMLYPFGEKNREPVSSGCWLSGGANICCIKAILQKKTEPKYLKMKES